MKKTTLKKRHRVPDINEDARQAIAATRDDERRRCRAWAAWADRACGTWAGSRTLERVFARLLVGIESGEPAPTEGADE